MTCTLIKDTLTKDFADKGAINVGNNKVIDTPLFDDLNSRYGAHFKNKFNLDTLEKPFASLEGKAVANEEFLDTLDELIHPELRHERRFQEELSSIKKNDTAENLTPEFLKLAGARRIEGHQNKLYKKLAGWEAILEESKANSPRETLVTTQDKIDRMKEVFDAEVLIDTSLDSAGVLLKADHPITKANGKPTIVVNPDKLFADTVFHEFGHLYVELLGGLKDPVVAKAVDQLMESQLWIDVENEYPELEGENLAKEVLAQALGVAGNNIYNGNLVEESIWQRLKQSLLMALNNIFGLNHEYNAIERIAGEMLSGKTRMSATARYNALIDQQQKWKMDKPSQDEIDAWFTELTETYQLREEDHVYRNVKTDEAYLESSSTFAKQISRNANNANYKGDFNTEYSDIHTLEASNYKRIFDSPRLPWALDKALENFFNGQVGEDLSFVKTAADQMSWYTYYTKSAEGDIVMSTKLHKDIVKNLDAINAEAVAINKNLAVPGLVGTKIHNALEQYIKDRIEDPASEPSIPDTIYDTDDNQMIHTVRKVIDDGLKNGSKFYTEQILFSTVAQMPGTADLIEIKKDGTFKIYDFKTTDSFINGKTGKRKTDQELYIYKGYMNQLLIYSTMLEEYGLVPAKDHLNIITISLDRNKFDPDNIDASEVAIKEVVNRNLSPEDPAFNAKFKKAKMAILTRFRSAAKMKEFNFKDKDQEINDLVKKIQRGLHDYRGLTNDRTGKFTETGDTIGNNKEIYHLEKSIKTLIGKNNSRVIFDYIENMRNALVNVAEHTNAEGAKLSKGYIQNSNYLIQAAYLIPDIREYIQNSPEDITIESRDKDELLQLLTETEAAVVNVQKLYDYNTKRLTANLMSENSNLMKGYYAEKYEIEGYQKHSHTDKQKNDEYVYQKLRENEVEISQKEFDFWQKTLNNDYTDLRWFEYMFADPGMSKSMFVQTVKKILDKVEHDTRIDLDNSIPDIVKWMEEIKFQKTGDPRKIWKEFLVKATHTKEDGTEESYDHASVIPEFTSDYRELYIQSGFQLEYYEREINKAFRKKDTARQEELKQKKKDHLQEMAKVLKKTSQKERVHPQFAKLSDEKKAALRFIHRKLEAADDRLYNASTKKLVKRSGGGDSKKIYLLPKMRMSASEARHNLEGTWKNIKSGLSDYIRPPADEDEFNTTAGERGELQDDEFQEFNTSSTDILGNPSYEVPVFYRGQLDDPSLQSFDIPTLLAMNEETTIAYENHKMVEADLFMITSALKNSNALKTDGLVSNNVVDKLKDHLPKSLKSDDNLTYKAVQASIDNRFYKRSYQGAYSKLNYKAIKFAEALSKGTSALLLAANFRSATMTGIQGSIYRTIEGIAGEHFKMADVLKGSKKAYADIGNVIADTQKQFPTSKTNLLIRRFGLETQYKALVNKFVQDNFVTKNLDESALFSITTIAETIVTANLMYTLTGNIKVMNADGKYINSEGKVTTKDKAMSLDEAYSVEDGKLKLHEEVVFTEKNLSVKYRDQNDFLGEKTVAATEVGAYIASVYADLYGQYNPSMKSVAEMHVAGKLAASMRKWLPRGLHRRWRGMPSSISYTFDELRSEDMIGRRFYSQDQSKFQEGYYVTGIRYFYSMLKEFQKNKASFMTTSKNVTKTMTFHERANLTRVASEMVVIALTSAGAFAAAILAKSMKDDDDEGRNQEALYYLAYILERIKVESQTFIDPWELGANIKNPAAAVNTLTRIGNLMQNLFDYDVDDDGSIDWAINDTFDRGARKGQYRIQKNLTGFLPGYKNIKQFMGIMGFETDESIKESFDYLK